MRKILLYSALCLSTFLACTRAVDDSDGRTVSFADLPQPVKDSLLYWTEHDLVIECDTFSILEKPEIICFGDKYTLDSETFGPWTTKKVLTRGSDGKKYNLAHNAPVPIIVRGDSLIIPCDYNILTVWPASPTFKIYKLH